MLQLLLLAREKKQGGPILLPSFQSNSSLSVLLCDVLPTILGKVHKLQVLIKPDRLRHKRLGKGENRRVQSANVEVRWGQRGASVEPVSRRRKLLRSGVGVVVGKAMHALEAGDLGKALGAIELGSGGADDEGLGSKEQRAGD